MTAATARMLAIDGIEVWAERAGSGDEPVLLLTGATLQATAWEPSFTDVLLAANCEIIRFDWRDVGRSTWRRFKDHPYTAHTLVSDAAHVLEAYELPSAHLVGFSMGGLMAQLFALAHPDKVRSLSLLASGYASARAHGFRTGARRTALFDVLAKPRPQTDAEQIGRLVEQWTHLCGRGWPFEPAAWSSRARRWIDRGHNWSCPHLHLWGDVVAHDRDDELRELQTPTLVVHGADDAMFPLEHGEAIADALPDSELIVLAGRGHEIHLDAQVAARVAAHIQRTASRGQANRARLSGARRRE